MSPPDDTASPLPLLSRAQTRPAASDPLWYKDAIIYQLHVKAFFDADDDGIGDFQGLCRKLDYLQDLGVTALWLLPFYPSPLRDDGYDISDYKNINPSYGRMARLQGVRARGASPQSAHHHRAGHQPYLGSASLVSAGASGKAAARIFAIFMCGAIPTRSSPKRESSLSTPRNRTGRGTRWRRPITGTDSTRISPTSISTIRGYSAQLPT